MVIPNFIAQACTQSQFLGIKPWYQYIQSTSTSGHCTLNFSIHGVGTIWLVLAGVTDILLRIGLYVSVGYFIFGAFKMVTSQGNPDQIKSARSTMVNALVGFIIALVATWVISFIIGTIFK